MATHQNTAEIQKSGIIPGISYIRTDEGEVVRLGVSRSAVDVPLIAQRGSYPSLDREAKRVILALPLSKNQGRDRTKPMLTGCITRAEVGILRCKASDIDLPFDPVAAAMRTRWPGLEGAPIYARSNSDPNLAHARDQIAIVHKGGHVYAVDGKGAVGKIVWTGTAFAPIEPVDRDELVRFLCQHGVRVESKAAVRWTWNSLCDLGAQNEGTEVRRRFDNLR